MQMFYLLYVANIIKQCFCILDRHCFYSRFAFTFYENID